MTLDKAYLKSWQIWFIELIFFYAVVCLFKQVLKKQHR